MLIFFSYIFYFIASSTGGLWRRFLMKKENPAGLGQINLAFKVMFIAAIIGSFIPFFSPFHIVGNLSLLLLLSLICGICGTAYFIASYISQKHIEAGVTNLVVNISTPVTIILATFFLNEKLTGLQVIGTILLLLAMVIVSKKHHIGKFKFDKYFLLLLAGGVFLGILLVAERTLQKTTGFAAGTLFSWWSQVLFLGIAVLITGSRHRFSRKNTIITGVTSGISSLAYVILVTIVGNLSLVSAVTTFKVVLMFIAGAVFLKEKEDLPRKIFGSIVALAGLLLMG